MRRMTTMTWLAATLLTVTVVRAQELDAELLTGHPGLLTGDFVSMREDILRALERAPDHPLAPTAAAMLGDLRPDGVPGPDSPQDFKRLKALAAQLQDAEASFDVRQQLLYANVRSRFAETPLELGPDVMDDFVRSWFVVGPLGPLHHPAPELVEGPESSPEYGIEADYAAADGRRRGWVQVTREPHDSGVRHGERVYPNGGWTYALTFVDVPEERLEAGRAVLEIHTGATARVFWNGARVIDEPRSVPSANSGRLLASVPVEPGWNAILVSTRTSEYGEIGARILDTRGRVIRAVQPKVDSPTQVRWTRAAEGGGERLEPPLRGGAWAPELTAPELFDGPFGPALRVLRARLAGQLDRGLVVAGPQASDGGDGGVRALAAWRLERLRTLRSVRHLPDEIRRRRLMDAVAELEASGAFFPEARDSRFRRLLGEDRPIEALLCADEWAAATPDSPWPRFVRVFALQRIDALGYLEQEALEELLSRFPAHRGARVRQVQLANRFGDARVASELAFRALTGEGEATPDGGDDELLDAVLAGAWPTSGDAQARQRAERLAARARRWRSEPTRTIESRALLTRFLEAFGRDDELLAMEQERVRQAPERPDGHWAVASRLLKRGEDTAAIAALGRELARNPSDATTRELLSRLGQADPAEAFFAEFAPDVDAAVAKATAVAENADDSSVIEALDSGMLYFFPDGSYHSRLQSVSIPLDREGTEELHSIAAGAENERIVVRTTDGRELEPVNVDGEWVLPALEPGDVVDNVWDDLGDGSGVPGAPVAVTSWRFASFDRAFPTSRWVVFVPEGLDAHLELRNFEGTHEPVPWEGGTAHVMTAASERQIAEAWQPSYAETQPLGAVGGDSDLAMLLPQWREYVLSNAELPADIALEADAFVREHRVDGDALATARALYEALDEKLQSYEGDEDAASVWQLERGWPSFLLASLYDLAGVPYEWAILESVLAPELDPEPVDLFRGEDGLAQAAIRLGERDAAGDPIWIIPGQRPGLPFGTLAPATAGAPAFVLEKKGTARRESVPRTQAASTFDLIVELTFTLDEAGDAAVTGLVAYPPPGGSGAREQVSELPPQQLEATLRGQAARFAAGVDVTAARADFDAPAEAGLVMEFEGLRPGFVAAGRAEVAFVDLQLPNAFGPAEREFPLALRQAQSLRVQVTIDPGEHWRIVEGPESVEESRKGFSVSLAVDVDGETGVRSHVQTFRQRGLVLAPEAVPAFLARMAEVDAQFGRGLRLEKIDD